MSVSVAVETPQEANPQDSIRGKSAAPNPIRVLIAEDQQFVTDALHAFLNRQPGMLVVGAVGSVVDALASVVALQPDVVILEFRLSAGNAEVIRRIDEGEDIELI